MHFPVYIALFFICSSLLEAVPTPQIQSVRGRWRPKVVREKEAAAAAAREAEKAAALTTEANKESAPAAREDEQVAVSLTQIINQVVEDVTEIAREEAITPTKKVLVREEGNNASLSTTDGSKSSSSIVTDEPFIVIDTTVFVSGQRDIVENTTEIMLAHVTATSENNSTEMFFSTNKKVENSVEDKNTCRLSLRGKSCTCRFEKTCRCDCGRIFSANNQHAAKSVRVPTPATNNRDKNSRRKIQRFQFPQSNKH